MALLIGTQGAHVLVGDGAPPMVYRRLRAVLPDGMVTEVTDATGCTFDVGYEVHADATGAFRILCDGRVVGRVDSVRGLCRKLRNHLEFEIAVRARTAQFVHAGVVAWRGRAILIPGDSNAGKSTLVGELVRFGATYYSDEYAVIDDSGKVHPYARRIGPMHDFRAAAPLPAIEPIALIATTYEPGATWAPVALHGARAVLPLLDHLFTARDEPQRAMRLAASVGPHLVALRGPRPDASEVAPAILEFVDRILDGMTSQAALGDAPRPVTQPPSVLEVLQDPGWVPVAVRAKRTRVRFRHYERPFHIGQAVQQPRPWDIELPREEIEAGAAALRDPAKVIYVYHHGYAGSTLLARLLDCPGTCLVYAEPNVHSGWYSVPALRKLLYRTFRADETPLIKLLPGEILTGAQHYADHPEARAVFLFTSLEEYVASTYAHEYRREYVTKLAQRFGGAPCTDPAEAAVQCWERITTEAITLGASHPLTTVESNRFFSDPIHTLEALWDWFGFPPRENWSATLECVASRHSKNGRPFTFANRLAQRDAYAQGARSWLDEHGPRLASSRRTTEALAHFSL